MDLGTIKKRTQGDVTSVEDEVIVKPSKDIT